MGVSNHWIEIWNGMVECKMEWNSKYMQLKGHCVMAELGAQ